MVELKVINLIQCPYCSKEWVREDSELVCEECHPALEVDLAVADLVNAIAALEKQPLEQVEKRSDLLLSIHHNLTELIKKMKSNVQNPED